MPDSPVDVGDFFDHVRKTIVKIMWAKAAQHQQEAGCEEGADLGPTRAVIRALKKQGKADEAGLATTIVAGGLWPAQRRKEAGYEITNNLCRVCGLEEDSEQNRLWKCKVWRQKGLKEVKATHALERLAPKGWKEALVFWLRGIVLENEIQCQKAGEDRVAEHRKSRKKTQDSTYGRREAADRIESNNLVW